ncbi:MAG TPA: DUF1761 domain-containing protein [Jiangellaceae bacterium]|nr:DUF1761 domain-containing protein [Jiangellaceae bacterium]
MSLSILGDLNWLAVIVAAIIYFALGGLWFMPRLFGNTWMHAIGWEPTDEDRPSAAVFVVPLITCLLAAIALGMLAHATGSDTFGEGIVLGLVAGIGLAGAALAVTAHFDPKSPKPWTSFGVHAGYHLIGMVITAVIVSVWT